MEQETASAREWAERIVRCEASDNQSAEQVVESIERACRKLLPPLAELFGERGYRLLLSRALVLAGRRVSWLSGVSAGQKGEACLSGLSEASGQREPVEIRRAAEEIMVSLIVVLASFIGARLVLYVLAQAYPGIFTGEEEVSE